MGYYSGTVLGITPSTTDDNYIVEGQTAEWGAITEVHWGGEVTTSTLMRTRVARGSGQAGAGTAGNTALLNPKDAAASLAFFTTYATTQPTLAVGDLFATSWNSHGGVVRWLAAPGEEFIIIGKVTPDGDSTICNRNAVGTALSSYGVIWRE